eukprot:6360315-Alexandrium_andersonii.AAC.1
MPDHGAPLWQVQQLPHRACPRRSPSPGARAKMGTSLQLWHVQAFSSRSRTIPLSIFARLMLRVSKHRPVDGGPPMRR